MDSGGLSSLIWPISGSNSPENADLISSPFGPRWQASQGRYDYHPGIDIPSPQNTPVHVITDGVVSKVGWLSSSSGLTVLVYHPMLDLYSAYLHLNSTDVIVSQVVTQGQIIGLVGDTGETDFMHLHFEVRLTTSGYPTATRNPMAYLPYLDVTTPTIRIAALQSDPIYSPTVSLVMTTTRSELDLNQIEVTLQDQATGQIIDQQQVDFNQRIPTGSDTLEKDGIQLLPSHFNTATLTYELTANFTNLHGLDAFTLTARATDLGGHSGIVTAVVDDTMPPEQVTTLAASWQPGGSVELNWFAPGDNGQIGTAQQYEIRYADVPLNSFSWLNATPLVDPPTPLPGGTQQTWLLPGPFTSPVYFALQAADENNNLSLISNSAQAVWPVFLPLTIKESSVRKVDSSLTAPP